MSNADLKALLEQLQKQAEAKPDTWRKVDGFDGVSYWWRIDTAAGSPVDLIGISSDDVVIGKENVHVVTKVLWPQFRLIDKRKISGRHGVVLELQRQKICAKCGNPVDSPALMYGLDECTPCSVRAKWARERASA